MAYRPIPAAQRRYADSGQRPVTFFRDPESGGNVQVMGAIEALPPADRGRYHPATHRITALFVPDVQRGDLVGFHHRPPPEAPAAYEVVDVEDPFGPDPAFSAGAPTASHAQQPVVPRGQFRATVPAAPATGAGHGIDPNAGKFLVLLVREV